MGFTIPTLLQVKGIDNNVECIWYAEAVGRIVKNGEYYYEAYYLVPSKTKREYLVYDEAYEEIPEESVMTKRSVKHSLEDAWQKMGMIMKETDNNTCFLKVCEPIDSENESDEEDIGSVNSYSTASDESNISNLIDDSEESSQYRDTVLDDQFRSWIPKDIKEYRIKSFIESLENKALHERDERTF